jgi:asparagine synthase (glutamine-hydrolysing)
MCGIYGIIDLDGRHVDARALEAMGRVTRHRGPDDAGGHADGACAIGMRRLSIIDLAGGHQPIGSADGRTWIVCNGEIYNFRELRRELSGIGHVFRTASDTEAVLHAYREWGEACVQRLNGMFAFAIWDAERRRLLIGRDRLGIKPLYYAARGGQLAFASEAKALLELPGAVREPEPAALASYFNLGYVPAPLSMFRGIAKLPPASLLVVEGGRTRIERYWRAPLEPDGGVSADEWVERVRAQLERSVRMQMVSDVPVGAFLSGGLDSSSVVALMCGADAAPVRTYSIGFAGSKADEFYSELPHARKVAQHYRTEHHEIMVRPDVATLLPRLLWHMDEPIADSAFITTHLVSEFARRDVKVILSGVGGDEIFAGYRRYLGDHYHGMYRRLPRLLRSGAAAASQWLPSDRHSRLTNLSRYAKAFIASADLPLEQRYLSYVEVFPEEEVEALLVETAWPSVHPVEAAFEDARGADALGRMASVDLATQLPDDLLLLTDKMSMASSLECRVPLLDHELVELTARVPQHVKLAAGELKHLMKRAVRGLLPEGIAGRSKRGFGAPMGAWLKTDLNGLLRHVLDREAMERRGWLRFAAIERLIAAHERMRIDGTDRLLAVLNFEIWARVFLDRRSPADVATELKEELV